MITDEDRKEFPYHTDDAIIGIKAIHALSDADLWALAKNKAKAEQFRVGLGKKTNPNWVTARIAGELYDRELIDEDTFDRMTR